MHGSVALTLIHQNLDRANSVWDRDLADTACVTTFSPASRIVVFSLNSSYSQCGLELVAYEVLSGKRLWWVRNERESSGACTFTLDGHQLLVPMQGSELLVYSSQNGTLLERQQSGGNESVQALAFDQNSTTLWLAGEKMLWQYQTQS